MRTLQIALVLATLLVCLVGCELQIGEPSRPSPPPVNQTPETPCPDKQCPDEQCPYQVGPIQRLEKALRHPNYGGGSCAHAGMQDALVAQGLEWVARQWRHKYAGGAYAETLPTICEALNLRYAYTTSGETHFLEWCSRTRRPACIFYYSRHAVTFHGFEKGYAVLVNNNSVGREIRVPKAKFLAAWNNYGHHYGQRGGMAFTVVYTPAPPPPVLYATTLPK